jgi:hypothetical protein
MACKPLRGLSPSVARKLFNSTVVPEVDYASAVRMQARKASAERMFKRVQAVVGCFQTVAETEANLPTIEERHLRDALRMLVDLHSILGTHPLAPFIRRRRYKRFISLMQRIAEGFSNRVIFAWAPVNPIFELRQRAKQLAPRSTDEG